MKPLPNPIVDGSKIGDVRVWTKKPIIKTDEGWQVADGHLVSRAKNPVLFSIIGESYCDERDILAAHFALPDYTRLK